VETEREGENNREIERERERERQRQRERKRDRGREREREREREKARERARETVRLRHADTGGAGAPRAGGQIRQQLDQCACKLEGAIGIAPALVAAAQDTVTV